MNTVTVTVESKVDPGWIEFVTGDKEGLCDVFFRGYCGYWMEGIAHHDWTAERCPRER